MPRTSERQKLLRQMRSITFLSAVWGDDEVAEEYLENEAMLLSYRVFQPSSSIPKSTALRELLWGYEESQFKQIVRVSRETFTFIISKIQNNQVIEYDIGFY